MNESGATSIEYAMIASGVAVAIAAVVMGVGTSVQTMFQSAADGFK
jgi:pilus assembly protein Flp/PilA